MRWNIDPILFRLGPLELRWYGLLFATGLLLAASRAPQYFKMWGLPKQHAERITLWVPVGMLLGAHYIHLMFYEQEGLFDLRLFDESGAFHPGRFWALGSGLASHGGGLGCFLALGLFWVRNGRPLGLPFHRYADATMLASIWVYPFVRLGNFFNSEIVGRPTEGPWGVIFERWGYTTPRHPVVLYEAALYFCELAFAAAWFNPRYARKLRAGATFYLFLTIHFSLRFIAEFAKDSQGVDEGWALNMGHLLSLPIVLVCGSLILFTKRFDIRTPLTDDEKAEIERTSAAAEVEEARLDAEIEQLRQETPTSSSGRSEPETGAKSPIGAHRKGKKKGPTAGPKDGAA